MLNGGLSPESAVDSFPETAASIREDTVVTVDATRTEYAVGLVPMLPTAASRRALSDALEEVARCAIEATAPVMRAATARCERRRFARRAEGGRRRTGRAMGGREARERTV